MGKLTGFIAAAVLMLGMGVANAEETPEILGGTHYKAMSKSEMSATVGENRNGNFILFHTNIQNFQNNQQQCLVCDAEIKFEFED